MTSRRAFWRRAIVPLIGLSATVSAYAQPAKPDEYLQDIKTGRIIAQANCSSCHAIGRFDKSTHPAAPPFRDLGQRYPIESLEEAFAEGISVGHRDMPEWRFDPAQIRELLAYLKSIQGSPPGQEEPQ